MYQALYRKYRPKTFNDVVGQDVIIQTLKNSIINNKINHAYLLAGPRGCGKTTIAKIFAQLVNCENSNGESLCNKCVFCTHTQDQSMDIIEMDAASNNGVDEIREINNKVNLVPSIGKYKIYIIDEVHMLSIGAFNALLKTLEEPPSHVIFILATTDPQKVPITILSRCQRFDLKKISSSKICERLKYICEQEKIKYNEDALIEISKLGDGCLRDSISILDQVISYTNNTISVDDVHAVNGTLSLKNISELMDELANNNLNNIINLITEYSNNGKSIIKITEDIINYIKSCILLKNNIENENIDLYKNFMEKFDTEQLIYYIEIMNTTLFDMKKFSDPKLLLELAFIKMIGQNNLGNKTTVNTNINDSIKKVEKIDTIEKEEVNKKSNINDFDVQEQKTKTISKKPIIDKNISQEIDKEIENFVNLRIDNTLSEFSKKTTLDIKQNLSGLMDFILDEEYSKYVTMVMDATLKAASDKYLIFTYKTEHLSNLFNRNIEQIEKIIKKQLNKDYKVISVSEDKWDVIKTKFNNKEKEYKYKEENIDIKSILSKFEIDTDDNMKTVFGELVEYK